MIPTVGRSCLAAAAVALLMVGTACNDLQGPTPKPEALDLPSPQQTREVSGAGTILVGSDMETTFLFDVKGDPTGTFAASDVMGNMLTTNPSTDPATSFKALRFSSSFCSDPSHGAEFDATGRLVEGGVVVDPSVPYTVKACDNGPGALGMDTWSIDIPSRGNFHRDGRVTGDIVKH